MAETIHCGKADPHSGHPNGTGSDGKPGWCPGSQGPRRDGPRTPDQPAKPPKRRWP